MGESFIESVSTQELNRIAEQAAQGGEYEAARGLVERELARRSLILETMQSVDMPYLVEDEMLEDPKPPVHNHGPAEGRGIDCGERTVDGNLRGWCMDEYIVPVDPMDDLNCESCQ